MFVTQVPVYILSIYTPNNNMVLLCNSGDPQGCTPKVCTYLCSVGSYVHMFAPGGQFSYYLCTLYSEPNNIYHNIYYMVSQYLVVIFNHASKSLHAVMMHMGHSGCPVEPLSVS